jgi:hypothetical protein
MVVSRLRSASWEERTVPGSTNAHDHVWSVVVELFEEDARHLETLTTKNFLKHLLVMTGEEPVFAARIILPIGGGRLSMESSDRVQMEKLKSIVAKLTRSSN